MATKLDYAKIPIASPRNNTRHDLSHRHLTTSSFCEVQPTLIQELIPNSHVEFSLSPFLRMLPLPSPSFTSIKVSNRQFFVPFRTIFPKWNEFITDTPTFSSSSRIPTIRDYDFAWFLLDTKLTSGSSKPKYVVASTASDFDIVVPKSSALNADTTDKYFKYTPAGSRVVKTLNSLGYVFGFYYEGKAGSPSHSIEYSFLPFLAYLKVYIDYYHPAQSIKFGRPKVKSVNMSVLTCVLLEINQTRHNRTNVDEVAELVGIKCNAFALGETYSLTCV